MVNKVAATGSAAALLGSVQFGVSALAMATVIASGMPAAVAALLTVMRPWRLPVGDAVERVAVH